MDETFDDGYSYSQSHSQYGDEEEEAALTEEELDLIKDRLRRRLKSILRP
jgi:hypothetical protein